MNKKRLDQGQVALILVLLMTIVGTAAVSLAGRQIIETRVQEVNVDSSQAMLAAQAGLEKALQANQQLSGSLNSSTSFSVSESPSGSSNAIVSEIKNGEVWEITNGGSATSLRLYWTPSPSSSGDRGIYVQVVTASGITDYAYGSGASFTGFTAPSGGTTISGRTFSYGTGAIDITGSTVIRVMILGGDTDLAFQNAGGGSLGDQLNMLSSTGTVTRGTEQIKQGLGYYESVNGFVPQVFDFTLYSGSSLSQ